MIYLREVPAELLLTEPGLAPLAALARGPEVERESALSDAVQLIRRSGGSRTGELLEFAARLATITLDSHTIEKIFREAGMTVDELARTFHDTEFGQKLVAQGRTEGRSEGRVEMLVMLLTERFGEHPGISDRALAMAAWPGAQAIHAITTAASWSDLPDRPPAA